MTDLIVYGTPVSPFVRKVEAVLRHKGVAYDFENINIMDTPNWYVEISPARRIPVLRDKSIGAEGVPGTIADAIHSTKQCENNRAEQSHEATRVRERGMRGFKSMKQAQRFVTAHATVQNLFNLGRHLVRAQHYRDLRISAHAEWDRAVA